MNNRRWQKNFTLPKEQLDVVIERYESKVSIKQICKELGLTYNKVHNNLRLAGKVKPLQPKVVQFEKNGYFDIDRFGLYYKF